MKTYEILLVEDSMADAELAMEQFSELSVVAKPHHVTCGDQALAYLRKESPFENAQRPDLVLLDLNLPGKNGHAVLAELKEDPDLKSIPVIIMSSSNDPRDIRGSYERHANAYLRKPLDFRGYQVVGKAIEAFWLNDATQYDLR